MAYRRSFPPRPPRRAARPASGVARGVQLGRLERIRLWQSNIAESAHKLLRVDRPDAADHPGAEIPISLKIRKAGNQQKRPFPLFCTLSKPLRLGSSCGGACSWLHPRRPADDPGCIDGRAIPALPAPFARRLIYRGGQVRTRVRCWREMDSDLIHTEIPDWDVKARELTDGLRRLRGVAAAQLGRRHSQRRPKVPLS